MKEKDSLKCQRKAIRRTKREQKRVEAATIFLNRWRHYKFAQTRKKVTRKIRLILIQTNYYNINKLKIFIN